MKPPRHIQCQRLLPLLLGFTAIQFLAKSDVRIQRYERFPHAMGVNVSGCTFYWDGSPSPLRRSDGQAAMQKSWQPPWPCPPQVPGVIGGSQAPERTSRGGCDDENEKKYNNQSGRGRGRGRRRRSSSSRITADASVTPLPIRSQVPGVIGGSPAPQRLLYGGRDDENKKTQQSIGDREKTRAAVTLPSVKHRHRSLDKPLADLFPGPWSSRRLTDTGTKASRRA